MKYAWHRYILAILMGVTLTLSAVGAQEKSLAGISIGATKYQVVAKFGEPTGKLIPLPPIEVRSERPTAQVGGIDQGQSPDLNSIAPNMLMVTNNLNGSDVWIGSTTIGGAAGPMGTTSRTGNTATYLPPWAYIVRANTLSMDQEQLIYKMNDTYSVGVTLTKEGNDFKVTDIVACSFEPLKVNAPVKSINMISLKKKVAFAARTSKGLTIGSTFGEVIKSYKWPTHCYPFNTTSVSKITASSSKSIPVFAYSYAVGNDGRVTITPVPDLYEKGGKTYGSFPVQLTDGKNDNIALGFTKHCYIIYPEEQVAFTIVNFKVVRIQIGGSIVAPPDAPPTVGPLDAFPTPTTGGGTTTPTNGGGTVEDKWW